MRALLIVMVVLVGCVDETDAPPSIDPTSIEIETLDGSVVDSEMDVCGLAAELPASDICSLVCDPDAMKEQMAVNGSQPGKCYQLYCQLTETDYVLVGVCLPPT